MQIIQTFFEKKKITNTNTLFSFLLLSFLLGCIFFAPVQANTEGTPQTFVVSAYYSPLPDQQEYVRGNYEAEKRLQGEGIRGADSTPVYVGMMAAPSTYTFGTKIYIPGLGVGTVHDRGGAIRAYENHDRIDVWMGYGDEGRKRALQWGMQTVEGKIMPNNTPENLNFTVSSKDTVIASHNILDTSLHIGRKGNAVIALQKALQKKGFFNGTISGVFEEETESAVLEFQKFHNILSKKTDFGAGVYGPKTRKKMLSSINVIEKEVFILAKTPEIKKEVNKEEIKPKNKENKGEKGDKGRKEIITEKMMALLQKGDTGERVTHLQEFLQREGFFEGKPTGYFGPRTETSLIAFQKQYQIINVSKDEKAGIYEKTTQEKIQSLWVPSNKKYAVDIEIVPKGMGIGDKNISVKRLQITLKTLGYFHETPTGTFGSKTQKAVLAFQKANNIVHNTTDSGAGYFGPKTHSILTEKLIEKRKYAHSDIQFKTKSVSEKTLAMRRTNKKSKIITQEKRVLLSSL